MSKTLLFDEYPIVLSASLATLIGMPEAAFIQRIHYQNQNKSYDPEKYEDHFIDGFYWVYNTYKTWALIMPYLGAVNTIQRMVTRLLELGLIAVMQDEANPRGYWYRVCYDKLEAFVKVNEPKLNQAKLIEREAKRKAEAALKNQGEASEGDTKMGLRRRVSRQNGVAPAPKWDGAHPKMGSHTEETPTEESYTDSLKTSSTGDAGGSVDQAQESKPEPKAKSRAPKLEHDPGFDTWMFFETRLYPLMPVGRRTGKADAYAAFLQPIDKTDPKKKRRMLLTLELAEQMEAKLKLYADHVWPYTLLEYVPHLSSWINANKFIDADEDILALGRAKEAEYRRKNPRAGIVPASGGQTPQESRDSFTTEADAWFTVARQREIEQEQAARDQGRHPDDGWGNWDPDGTVDSGPVVKVDVEDVTDRPRSR